MDPTIQKLPPQSIESEESFLSACLLGAAGDAVELLNPDDFYRSAHGKIFKAICSLSSSNEPVDLVTVMNALRDLNELEEIGGASYLSRLTDTVPSAMSVKTYAKIIKTCAKKRMVIEACSRTIQECYNGNKLPDILSKHDSELSQIKLHGGSFVKIGDLLPTMIDQWDDMINNPRLPGIPTGLIDIDRKFGGLPSPALIVIGARPGMGKSALGMRFARGAAQRGYPVAQISLEMSKEQLLTREVSCESGIDGERFSTGQLQRNHWERIAEASQRISTLPIYVDDSPTATIKEIQSKIRTFYKKHGRCLIEIDYLDYIRGEQSERKDLEIGTITKGLKASAKEHDIPIVLFVQLNRQCELRTDKRPVISDLRNSGEIEQDADVIAFIYRDEVYNEDQNNPNKGIAEFIVRKHRNGKTGPIKLAWIAHRTTFEDLAR